MFKKFICLVCFVILLGMVITSGANAADPNLVGWWKFDDGSGDTANDSSGNGFDIPLQDNLWGNGVFGGAVHFPGEGQGQRSGFVYSNNAITVCAWVWHEAFRTGQVERYVTAEPEIAVIRKEAQYRRGSPAHLGRQCPHRRPVVPCSRHLGWAHAALVSRWRGNCQPNTWWCFRHHLRCKTKQYARAT